MRALEIAVHNFNLEVNKMQQKKEEEIKKQLEDQRPYRSSFSDVPLPNLHFK
jgi:hypothetical protein